MLFQPHIAVIGAGISGSVLTSLLLSHGFRVSVFDKSRGTGGRASSCRMGEYQADLGVPYFEALSGPFEKWLLSQPEIMGWQAKEYGFDKKVHIHKNHYVATPKQSALTRRLIQGADFIPQQRVGYLWPEYNGSDKSVILRNEHGKSLGLLDAASVTAPAYQAAELLEAVPRFVNKANQAKPSMCWVHVIAIGSGISDSIELISGQHAVISRAIKDSAKPNRSHSVDSEVWVIEATEDWSASHCHSEPEAIAIELQQAFSEVLNAEITVLAERTHRWLYARHNTTEDECLWDPDSSIGACGDWLHRGGSEGAWASANQMAECLIAHFRAQEAFAS